MPGGPVINTSWMPKRPEPSVVEGVPTKLLRLLGDLAGTWDAPGDQVMGLGGAMEVPGGEGLLGKVLGAAKRKIRAYHGSPHDFPPVPETPLGRFDASKIGTGEGAQAYGHGLYFAEAEDVAQEYERVLSNRRFHVGNRDLYSTAGGSTKALDGQTMAERIAADSLDDALNAQSSSPAQFAANRLREQRRLYPEQAADIDQAMNLIADWQQAGEKSAMGGKMYEVEIDASPEDLLDWDQPLSRQSERVRAAIAAHRGPEWVQRNGDLMGRNAYEAMGAVDTPDGYAASVGASRLRDAGVPGIKYLDGASRRSGEGTSNYVIFDDNLITILRKYGVAGAVGAGYSMQQVQQAQQMEQQALQQSLGSK